jgi:hypothetical protein
LPTPENEKLAKIQNVKKLYLKAFSPRIFEKFEMVLKGHSGVWGKLIHEKNLKLKKSRVRLPLTCPSALS